jgi:CheY-like chemotaxis protein
MTRSMINKVKVLIVEDNDALREMFRRRLLRRGYDLILAADGEEGLIKAAENLPQIILLDMSLPGRDGWSIASELKSNAETKGIRIIAITAHAMRGDREKALSHGCDGYVSKPINFTELFLAMESL